MAKRKKEKKDTYLIAYVVRYEIPAKSEDDALRILEAHVESTLDTPPTDLNATKEELDSIKEDETAYIKVLGIV
jgi:hypothetical protein